MYPIKEFSLNETSEPRKTKIELNQPDKSVPIMPEFSVCSEFHRRKTKIYRDSQMELHREQVTVVIFNS